MAQQGGQFYLEALYGSGAVDTVLAEVRNLEANSNFPFHPEYIKTGISFISHKAQEIYEGVRKKPTLKNLVSESFGEAAIYNFNILGK